MNAHLNANYYNIALYLENKLYFFCEKSVHVHVQISEHALDYNHVYVHKYLYMLTSMDKDTGKD